MIIRTFNGEVDSIIKKLTFRNIDSSKNKVQKSFDALNNLNEKNNLIKLSDSYLRSKIKELDLNYGKHVKEQEEKERHEEEKELLREQKAAEREIQNQLKKQEKEKKRRKKKLN